MSEKQDSLLDQYQLLCQDWRSEAKDSSDLDARRTYFQSHPAFIRCREILNNADYTVERVLVENMKRLDHLSIHFDPRLTVLIGENATGKTTVCESLTKVFSWILSAIKQEDFAGADIDLDEIKHGKLAGRITIDLILDAYNQIPFSLVRNMQEGAHAKPSDFEALRAYATVIRDILSVDSASVTLPLFIFYGVNRTNFTRSAREIYLHRSSAYDHALEDKVRVSDMIEWFIMLDNLSQQDKLSEVRDLQVFQATLQETIAGFKVKQQQADFLQSSLLSEMITDLEGKIAEAQEKIDAIKARPFTTAEKLKALVNETVRILIPNASAISVDRSSGKARVVLDIFGEKHDIQYLSHGQRSVLFMVADLLSRLEILNPHLEDPRHSPGIVIIDEIELHLHPTWQQTIIDSLLKIFPNIQFIITTHSPQVISSVHKDQIRFLKNDFETHEVKVHSPTFQTRGLSSDNILLRILNIAEAPDTPEFQKYQQLEKLIENNLGDSEEAQKLYQLLEKHFGADSLEMEKLQSLKRLQAMRQRILTRQNQLRSAKSIEKGKASIGEGHQRVDKEQQSDKE